MSFTISAEFRFGFYQGGDRRGAPERYPTPLRLHAALVSAAHERRTGEEPNDSERAAIKWIESHAPDAIELPEVALSSSGARTYRDKGNLHQGRAGVKAAPERASRISALGGHVRWWWENSPPPAILDALADLCHDVPYLGEAASPVRLVVTPNAALPEMAHQRVPQATLNDDHPVYAVAREGRYDALRARFDAAHVRPRVADDKYARSEEERSGAYVTSAVEDIAYATPMPKVVAAPWTKVIGVQVTPAGRSPGTWTPHPEDFVRWSLVMHRALVRLIGSDAPPLVTGRYEAPGGTAAVRPANRLAIQILPPRDVDDREGWSFGLLIPQDADPYEVDAVRDAVARLNRLYRRAGEELLVRSRGEVETHDFWKPPVRGMVRWWTPSPVMIAEGHRQGLQPGGRAWTAADAVALAVGFVWRDDLGIRRGNLAERNTAFVQAVQERGVYVAVARRDLRVYPPDFAHKLAQDQVITPISALLRGGTLIRDRQLAAIGQSRHLGGGLLMPVDLPAAALDEEGVPAWLRR